MTRFQARFPVCFTRFKDCSVFFVQQQFNVSSFRKKDLQSSQTRSGVRFHPNSRTAKLNHSFMLDISFCLCILLTQQLSFSKYLSLNHKPSNVILVKVRYIIIKFCKAAQDITSIHITSPYRTKVEVQVTTFFFNIIKISIMYSIVYDILYI